MSKPGKPDAARAAALIDVDDNDQMIRLALATLFTVAEILRASRPGMTMPQVAAVSLATADQLIDAVTHPREAP